MHVTIAVGCDTPLDGVLLLWLVTPAHPGGTGNVVQLVTAGDPLPLSTSVARCDMQVVKRRCIQKDCIDEIHRIASQSQFAFQS